MNTKIYDNFQIRISVPLSYQEVDFMNKQARPQVTPAKNPEAHNPDCLYLLRYWAGNMHIIMFSSS